MQVKIWETRSSRRSSSWPTTPALKKILVWPNLYISTFNGSVFINLLAAFFGSGISSGTQAGLRILYLCRKSGYTTREGNPLRQIRIPSNTPLHLSWCKTKLLSQYPGFFSSFGIIQRTKCGCVERKFVSSRLSDSRCNADTVWNDPPFWRFALRRVKIYLVYNWLLLPLSNTCN